MARRRRRKMANNQAEPKENAVIETISTEESLPVNALNTDDYDDTPIDQLVEELKEDTKDLNIYYEEEETQEEDIEIEEIIEKQEEEEEKQKAKVKVIKEQQKLKVDEKKTEKEPKEKKISKRQQQKIKDFEDIKSKKAFKYKKKKYSKIEDFIKYLDDNYLDIDKIAKDIVDDENFLGWISNKSEDFKSSMTEFKKIKKEIENN